MTAVPTGPGSAAPPEPGSAAPTGPGAAGPGPRGVGGARPEPTAERDAEGTSAERTRLAWRRTVLATTVTALLTVRLALHDGFAPTGAFAVLAAVAGWLTHLWFTHHRIQAMAHREPAGIGRTLPTVALVAVGFAALGLALVISGAGG